MKQAKRAESNLAVQALGVFVFIIGVLFCLTCLLLPAGIPLVIASARMGYKKRNVWRCRQCGYFYERA